jgi:putative phosphoribosyl transferase
MTPLFDNRTQAGRALARQLSSYANRPEVLVLALPRGGVPVGYEVAHALNAPLDVLIVRKLGLPSHPEFAIGAIASGGVRVLNQNVLRLLHLDEATVEQITRSEQRELERREQLYRGERPAPEVRGRTVILVDDGLATGQTMLAAIKALKTRRPQRLVVAVPTAAADTCEDLRAEADEVICATTPEPFRAVGLWYEDFSQTSDEEVRELLARAQADAAHPI